MRRANPLRDATPEERQDAHEMVNLFVRIIDPAVGPSVHKIKVLTDRLAEAFVVRYERGAAGRAKPAKRTFGSRVRRMAGAT